MTVPEPTWELPARGRVAMFGLIAAEAAIFVNFRRRVPLLRRQEPDADPCRRTSCEVADLLYHLPAFQQPDDSLGRQSASKRKDRKFRNWWFGTIALGATFLYGTAREWYRLIYRGWVDDQHQPVRNDILFAGRPARLPRDCRPDLALHRHGIHAFWDM